MCGLIACYSKTEIGGALYDTLSDCFKQISHRGDPNSSKRLLLKHVFLGSHSFESLSTQLSIGNKYMVIDSCIYNYDTLIAVHEIDARTSTPIKHNGLIILNLYASHRQLADLNDTHSYIKGILNKVDGDFAGVIYDQETHTVHAFRDPHGVRPLFYGFDSCDRIYFASEMKALFDICKFVDQVKPGMVMTISFSSDREEGTMRTQYGSYCVDASSLAPLSSSLPTEFFTQTVRTLLIDAVVKRFNPKTCLLLSGGLNSSLLASIIAHDEKVHGRKVHTYAFGLSGSPDLEYAQQVANHIGSEHTSITCTENDLLLQIPHAIRAIESFDVSSVRHAVCSHLACKYISEHTDFKAIITGDFADEVMSGHTYMKQAPCPLEFEEETLDLVRNAHYFSILTIERVAAAHRLQLFLPFADKAFTDFYLRIPTQLRMPKTNYNIEKFLIRRAFVTSLPPQILWRKREQMSDGISSHDNSWHKSIRSYCEQRVGGRPIYPNSVVTKEAAYYLHTFENIFPSFSSLGNIVPYVWMPKWHGDVYDPSARELENLST